MHHLADDFLDNNKRLEKDSMISTQFAWIQNLQNNDDLKNLKNQIGGGGGHLLDFSNQQNDLSNK